MDYLRLYQVILIIAWLVIIVRYICRSEQPLPFFASFLTSCVIFEIVLNKWAKIYWGTNIIVYNLFFILCVIYYFVVFIGLQWKGTRYVIGLWLLTSLSNFVIGQGIHSANTYTWISGIILILTLAIYECMKIINDPGRLILSKNAKFVLAIGILLLYAASFPLIVNLNGIAELPPRYAVATYVLVHYANIFLSLSYLYIAVCLKSTIK